MPAELAYREDGTAIMAVAETPAWHGEGFTALGRRLTLEELETVVPEWAAPVEARPLLSVTNGYPQAVATHVANTRLAAGSSPEKVVGIVGKRRYQLVQNLEAFRLAEGIMGLQEEAQVASAGLLRDGSVAILTLYLGEDYLVPGLESERRGRYLNVVNSFDASYALTAVNSDVRMVCANTLRWNLRQPRKVAIRHTGLMADKLEHARRALGLADRYAQLQAIVAEHLVEETVTAAKAEEFFATLVPLPVDSAGKAQEGRALNNARQLREALANLYWTNPTVAPVQGSRWGLLQAVTFYTNHQQERRQTALSTTSENRFEAVVLDDSSPLEAKAQRLLETTKLRTALAAV
jgi:phage/plasmid-like protein (TIGR03299 family)